MSPAGRGLRVAVAAAALVGATAGPAAAHVIGGGAEPTNYRTVVRGFQPPVPGLEARNVTGDRLELVNGTGQEVLVLGYRLEPYLRVGPDGAFENRRSPSAYANRFATAPASIPAEFDAAAAPDGAASATGRGWRGTTTAPAGAARTRRRPPPPLAGATWSRRTGGSRCGWASARCCWRATSPGCRARRRGRGRWPR